MNKLTDSIVRLSVTYLRTIAIVSAAGLRLLLLLGFRLVGLLHRLGLVDLWGQTARFDVDRPVFFSTIGIP